jgi:hypothetical protein
MTALQAARLRNQSSIEIRVAIERQATAAPHRSLMNSRRSTPVGIDTLEMTANAKDLSPTHYADYTLVFN